jgi:teichuronic acid biosynthesis glycosyltransferase TuaC
MRVLFVTSIFPQPCNVLRGLYSYHLCHALAKRHEVEVLSPTSWIDKLRLRLKPKGFKETSSNHLGAVKVHYPLYLYPPSVLRFSYAAFMWWSVRRTILNLLRRFQPDCICSYWTHPDGAVAVQASRQGHIPCAVMVGGSDVLLLPSRGIRRTQVTAVLNAADAVLPVGARLRNSILQLGIPPAKISVVPRGIDLHLFSAGDRQNARRQLKIPLNTNVLLYVGNMVHCKGIDILLTACALLARTRPNFRLYLVGQGPLRTALEMTSREQGLSSLVTFVGPVQQTALPTWYRAANVTVLPSRSEGVPNVLRETLACNTPFVASRTGGIPELAGDPVSELVTPEDPLALSEAIDRVLSKPPSRIAKFCATGSWDESAKRLSEILSALVEQQASAPHVFA